MKTIPLSGGTEYAKVSDCDYERLSQFTWHVVTNTYKHFSKIKYARRWNVLDGCMVDRAGRKQQKKEAIYMHREICGLNNHDRQQIPHHLDDCGLNNQRENLEVISFNENLKLKRCLRKSSAGLEYVKAKDNAILKFRRITGTKISSAKEIDFSLVPEKV